MTRREEAMKMTLFQLPIRQPKTAGRNPSFKFNLIVFLLSQINTNKAISNGVAYALSPTTTFTPTTRPPTAAADVITGVTLKLALDQQWAVADGPASSTPTLAPQRFTCAASLDLVHRLRRDCQGVLVGRTTVERDDCSLTVRRVPLYHPEQPQPTRIIVDPRLSLLLHNNDVTNTAGNSYSIPHYQIFRDGYPTIIYHAVPDLDPTFIASLPDAVQCIYLPPINPLEAVSNDHPKAMDSLSYCLSPTAIWNHLQQHMGMSHILVEGGPTTALRFLPVVDRILLIRAPLTFPHTPVVSSHLSNDILEDYGFVCLGTAMSDVDTLEYWTRPHLSWPTTTLSDWP